MATLRVCSSSRSFVRWNASFGALRDADDDYSTDYIFADAPHAASASSSSSVGHIHAVCPLLGRSDAYLICATSDAGYSTLHLVSNHSCCPIRTLPSMPLALAAVQVSDGFAVAWTPSASPLQVELLHSDGTTRSTSHTLHARVASLQYILLPHCCMLLAQLEDGSLCAWWLESNSLRPCFSSAGPLTHSPCVELAVTGGAAAVACALACVDGTFLTFELSVDPSTASVAMSPICSTRVHAHDAATVVSVSPAALACTGSHEYVIISHTHAWRITGRAVTLLGELRVLLDETPPIAAVYAFLSPSDASCPLNLACIDATDVRVCSVMTMRTEPRARAVTAVYHQIEEDVRVPADGTVPVSVPAAVSTAGSPEYVLTCIATRDAAPDSVLQTAAAAVDTLTARIQARVEAVTAASGPTSLERTQSRGGARAAPRAAGGGDKFITFHARIKSSGYGGAPAARGKPSTSRGGRVPAVKATTSAAHVLDTHTYNVDTAPMREVYLPAFPAFDATSRAPVHAQSRTLSQTCWPSAALTCMNLNTSGSLLVAGASDGCLWTCPVLMTASNSRVRLQAARAQRLDMSASLPHIRHVSMSHAAYAHTCTDSRDHVLLACGHEKRAVLAFAHTCAPFLIVDSTLDDSHVQPFPASVTAVALCAQDQLVACASRGVVYLYAWAPPPPIDAHARTEDIVRSRTKQAAHSGAYECVGSVAVAAEGYAVESIAAHNAAQSHIMCVTSNDKSMSVVDLGVGAGAVEVLRVVDAHTRPAHSIAMVTASAYADITAPTYDAVCTASYDGTIKLWDLRAGRCEMQVMTGAAPHRSHACGLAISPCARYVTVGSEERCAVTYDLRTGREAERLRGATDVVTDVAYHPLAPALMTVSLDAALRVYVPPAAAE